MTIPIHAATVYVARQHVAYEGSTVVSIHATLDGAQAALEAFVAEDAEALSDELVEYMAGDTSWSLAPHGVQEWTLDAPQPHISWTVTLFEVQP